MRILLLGDASNYHNTLAKGLASLGHDVTVASNGSRWMRTDRDIDLSRRSGKLGGALLWLRLNTVLANRLKGYDVVQIVNPIFVEQQPSRVATLFRRLKRDNGKVCLTALGTDTAYVEMSLADDCPLRYTEWAVEGKPTPFALSEAGKRNRLWLSEPLASHTKMIYENVDGIVSALYEYHLAVERYMPGAKLAYGGIPVDMESIPFVGNNHDGDKPCVLAPYHKGRELEKGTDILRAIAEKVPGIDLQPVTGLTFADFQRRLADARIILDQYYSYTPATTALMAMAMGKTVVTGAEPDFETFIGDKVPAFNVNPLDHEALRDFLASDEYLRTGGLAARQFVEKHNSAGVVAARFINFWNSLC